MPLFSKERSYLGVDIGAYNIKIVELAKEKGRPKLLTYGFSDRLAGESSRELLDNLDEAVAVFKQVYNKAKVKTDQAAAALPISSIFTSIINLTNTKTESEKEVDQAIKWEAKKVIPLPLEEMTIHYRPLPTKTKEKIDGQMMVNRFLLTAAPQEVVKKYLEFFKRSGLKIIGLETESFALVRSLVGNDKSAVMVVDLGEASTNIMIIKQGVPILNRSIDTAGFSFTKIFQDHLKIDRSVAEQFKRDLSNLEQVGKVAALSELLKILVHEINYCFNLYQQEADQSSEQVEKIILTGGSALLPQLDSYLFQALKIKVFVGDPWARVVYPEALKPVLDQIGPKMSVAVGLAMREID